MIIFIIKNNLIKDFSDFLENISGQKFEFVQSRDTDKMLFCKIGNGTIAFDLIASTGTQSLKLLYFWLKKMGQASFVFIDELIGKDLTKKLSFIAAGVIAVGAVMMLLTGVLFRGMNNDGGFGLRDYGLAAGPIVFAILSFVAAACNAAAPVLENKGF